MRIVCSYCEKEIGTKEGDENAITHGICANCKDHLIKTWKGITIMDYVNLLEEPVFVVSSDRRIVEANDAAKKYVQDSFDTSYEEKRFLHGGEFFECAYAMRQDGCGNDVHCPLCTIRSAVLQCHRDGIKRENIEAYLVQNDLNLKVYMSVEKQDEVVLLHIHQLKPVESESDREEIDNFKNLKGHHS
jgi:hypothetical protein